MHGDAALFGVKFFGMDEFITQSNITPSDYETLDPLFTFDVMKQEEKLKSSSRLTACQNVESVGRGL